MYRRIFALNNHGMDSLRHGRHDDAILSLRHAIFCSRSLVATETTTNKEGAYSFVLLRSPLYMIDPDSISVEYRSSMFDIYQAGFYFPSSNVADQVIPEVAIVLIYNLGLAYHLAALNQTSESNLKYALRCYKIALTGCKAQGRSTLAIFVLALGCMTNMGHIFCHFWERENAMECLIQLERMLSTAETEALLPTEEASFFSTAFYFWSDQMQGPAPAA